MRKSRDETNYSPTYCLFVFFDKLLRCYFPVMKFPMVTSVHQGQHIHTVVLAQNLFMCRIRVRVSLSDLGSSSMTAKALHPKQEQGMQFDGRKHCLYATEFNQVHEGDCLTPKYPSPSRPATFVVKLATMLLICNAACMHITQVTKVTRALQKFVTRF